MFDSDFTRRDDAQAWVVPHTTAMPQGSSAAFTRQHCDWRWQAEQRLVELCCLVRGWDGHNGRPVNRDTAEFAATVIASIMLPTVPMPSIMPLSYGGIQVEWHRNRWDVEIEISEPYHINVYTRNIDNGSETHTSLHANLSGLRNVIALIQR